jgi:hypothetical protein
MLNQQVSVSRGWARLIDLRRRRTNMISSAFALSDAL